MSANTNGRRWCDRCQEFTGHLVGGFSNQCADCHCIRANVFTESMRCVACADWRGNSVAQAIGHELNRHDGAQTCWWQREIDAAVRP